MWAVDMRPAAGPRARLPGLTLRPTAGVADPARGTRVAVGLPIVALALAVLWVRHAGVHLQATVPIAVALVAVAAAAERIVVPLGPRSWYTASTPAVVLAGLLGGPLVGVAAGVATQGARTEAVWRRRCAEGGISSIQGLAAGILGLAAWTGATDAMLIAATALSTAIVVNSVGRLLVMLDRSTSPLRKTLLRGFLVDCLELVLMTPLLAVLLITSGTAPWLVVTTMASVLAALVIARRTGAATAAALVSERVNARRDQLTGAPNRRAFEEALASEHSRIVRGLLPAGLFVIDIDDFKSVNDRYGHRVGDEVLVEVVSRLTGRLRPSDTIARWGGEELTVLAPGIHSRRQLERFGERIRVLVEESPFTTSTAAVPITVSVGGTALDGSVAPAIALRRADGAMYDAKRTRNAVLVAVPSTLSLHREIA